MPNQVLPGWIDMWPSVLVGTAVSGLGAFWLYSHYREWKVTTENSDITPPERTATYVRLRRRVQASALVTLIGILIPIGDMPIWVRFQAGFGIYWLVVVTLVLWVILMAFADWFANRVSHARSRQELQRLAQARAALEAEVARLRQQHAAGPSGEPPGVD